MGDAERAAAQRRQADEMRGALGAAGWDGAWYRRGYYDDGTPLGSAERAECRIDALAQAHSRLRLRRTDDLAPDGPLLLAGRRAGHAGLGEW
jgi:cyclic beta-1,2-glucan synthetase